MKKLTIAGGALLATVALLGSCKGRTADSTPTGDTVEVDIQNVEITATDTVPAPAPTMPAPETADTAVNVSAVAENSSY
ncbi:MAG: hypothetical protein J6L73_03195 [Muribaculaceae bacterium]|nr:hypothetical protein [Muribaculaceae bacterium]